MNIKNHERKIITKDKLSFELNFEDKTANIVNNDQACEHILIPRSIEYGQIQFIVKIIKQKSFENSNTIKQKSFENSNTIKSFDKYISMLITK